MSETMRDVTLRKLKAVKQELSALRNDVMVLEAQEEEILHIIKMMGYQMSGCADPEGPIEPAFQVANGMTIKEMATAVLAAHPDGLSAEQILAKIHDRFDVVINETSLPPQLSRLKRKEVIFKEDGRWRLKQKSAG